MGNQASFEACKQGCGHIEDGDVVVENFVRELCDGYILSGSNSVPVYLNVYHLSDAWLESNRIFQLAGIGGAFHAGIEVHGQEWSYCSDKWTYGHTKSGISCTQPRTHEVHVFHESVLVGETNLSKSAVRELIEDLLTEWPAEDYNLLENNCCNFSDAFSQVLVGEPIPAWVIRFPQIANTIAAHLDNVIDVKQIVRQISNPVEGPPTPRAVTGGRPRNWTM